jgi:phospholipid-transporting ATPase
MAGTFGAVLVFTMFKEAYEDWARHKQDNQINNMKCRRISKITKNIEEVLSRDIKVGDILYVGQDEFFPADLVFLSSNDPKGLSFVNTMNLDGEVNLKEKTSVTAFAKMTDPGKIIETIFEIECDQPNISLVKWNCNMTVNGHEKEPLNMKQLLLRGCSLQNTEFIFGVVIYTGHDTKIMLNSKKAPSKSSNVLRKMNKILYSVFAFQLFLCLLLAGLSIEWMDQEVDRHPYLDLSDGDKGLAYFIQVLTFLVAYSHLIPISLYVALEVLKLGQAFLISQDLSMFFNDKPAACRSSDLVEELGQVEFVFSDKTGTLTCNEMEFRRCSINGIVYGSMKESFAAEGSEIKRVFDSSGHSENGKVRKFFEFMAVCHSVFPALDKNSGEIVLQASSPDELALVDASKKIGLAFFERSEGKVMIKDSSSGKVISWEVLVEVPFNSDRKRMSVIARNSSGQVLLMTKGADSMMLPLLQASMQKDQLSGTLLNFAVEGLRTLVMGQRVLSQGEFEAWHSQWKRVLLGNDPNKESKLDDLGASIEKNLEFVGCSAIEDKLQDGVPEAIALLMSAGIRVWVLTGDKEETAIEIGKSCNLLQSHMETIKLSSKSSEDIKNKLEKYDLMHKLKATSFPDLEKKKKKLPKKLAIVIDGLTLTWVLEDSELKKTFFNLGFLSASCICCRVSPAQKMQVVQLAKSTGPWVTLSIGDGANDVSMIQEAHIGVGISGKEGAQAVQAADFSFSQFRFLTRLLLAHGRWAYKRISWFICYYFYKNIAVVFTEIWFAFFNGFSGQIYFLDWLPMLYNSFWTSWPCMVAFLVEQDVNAERSLKYPALYAAGQRGMYFNVKRFWIWVVLGVWHGTLSYWIPVYTGFYPLTDDGSVKHLWWISTVSFSLIIHIVTLKLFLENMHWNLYSM